MDHNRRQKHAVIKIKISFVFKFSFIYQNFSVVIYKSSNNFEIIT